MSGSTMSTIEHGMVVRRLFFAIQARNIASSTRAEDVSRVVSEMWFRSEERKGLLERIGAAALSSVELL